MQTRSKKIAIQVSETYALPDFYVTNEPMDCEEALTMGAFLHEQMTYHKSSTDVQKLEEQKARELAQLKDQLHQLKTNAQAKHDELEKQMDAAAEAHATKLRQLLETQELKEASIRKGERDIITKDYDAKLKALNADLTILSEQNRGLQARKEQLEQDRAQDIQEAEERCAKLLQTTLDEKERTIQRLDGLLTNMTNSYTNLKDSFHQFSEAHLKKTLTTKSKGTEYEDILSVNLKKAYGVNPSFSLEETAKSSVGHEADIVMNWNDKKILWEGKWYSSTVPHDQILKFERDMKQNPHILVGVMMSRYTGISGKCTRSDVQTEFIGNQMLIYISRADTLGDTLYSMLPLLWQVHWESKRERNDNDEKDKAIRHIDVLIAAISARKKEWAVHKSKTNEMLKWMDDRIGEDEAQLKKIFTLLKSGDKSSSTESTSENLFVDPEGNTTMEDTIAILKKIIVPANEQCILLGPIAEAFVKESPTKLTVDTAKSRIRKVFLPALIEANKGTPIVIHGIQLK
jgi:hypothetical protein